MAGRRRGHPAVEDAGETRRTILRAAHALFMAHGYRAVSTRQIADACGLTQPALYHHFADKQDLYVAMLREELAALHAGLERIARRGGDVDERLRQVVRYMPTERQDMSQMFHDIDRELGPEARRELRESFHDSVVAPIAAIFADGLRRGLLRDPRQGGTDPVTAAFLLLSMLRHPPAPDLSADSQDSVSVAPSTTATSRVDLIVDVLLHGLAAPKARDEMTGLGAPEALHQADERR
jgi:AcrR family transcriptional regulator